MEDSPGWDTPDVDASLEETLPEDHDETANGSAESGAPLIADHEDAPFDVPTDELEAEQLQSDEPDGVDAAVADATSETFLGKWTELVSSTNWEKGRIIHEWRQALVTSGAAPRQYSDEAWSQRVGNVTGQHVGRLRRVFERFGAVRRDYQGLYWSHFQAALDWDDAEMWLEGAVQSGWSISMMREHRAATLGVGLEATETAVSADLDEDFSPVRGDAQNLSSERATDTHRENSAAEFDGEYSRASEGSDFGNEPGSGRAGSAQSDGSESDGPLNTEGVMNAPQPVRPFAALPALPDDLQDAFENFKLAILRHKLAQWQEVPCDDVLASLDALKQLAVAPT